MVVLNEELLIWQILTIVMFFVSAGCFMMVLMGAPVIFKFLKVKIFRKKGYCWQFKFFKDHSFKWDFAPLEKEIKFGKTKEDEDPDVSIVGPIMHHERTTNIPAVVAVEGNLTTVDLNNAFKSNHNLLKIMQDDPDLRKKLQSNRVLLNEMKGVNVNHSYPAQELARIANQTNVRALNTGVMIGQSLSTKSPFGTPIILILFIVLMAIAGAAVFFGFQNYETLQQLLPAVQSVGSVVLPGG